MQLGDPRAQTALAWARTSLAAGGFGAAMLRVGAVHHSTADVVAAVALLACGLLLAVHARALYAGKAPDPAALLAGTTAATVLTGALVGIAVVT